VRNLFVSGKHKPGSVFGKTKCDHLSTREICVAAISWVPESIQGALSSRRPAKRDREGYLVTSNSQVAAGRIARFTQS